MKTIRSILFYVLILSVFVSGIISTEISAFAPKFDEEEYRYIVILEEPEVLNESRVYSVLNEHCEEQQSRIRGQIISNQDEMKAKVKAIAYDAFKTSDGVSNHSFTDVLNGFTVEVSENKAKEIEQLEGVKEVVRDAVIYINDPGTSGVVAQSVSATDVLPSSTPIPSSLLNPSKLIGADALYESGYKGEGRVIAVLDTELDYNNDYFRLTNPQNAKYTKAGIATVISQKKMNVAINANQVYRSAKIPFAYNYAKKSTSLENSRLHGSHVSGIAVGNSHIIEDASGNGGVLHGIAPEAQLMFFGIFNDDGSAYQSTVIVAIDDAVKFDVDAINLSLGTDYLSENTSTTNATYYKRVLENAQNSGCSVVHATGNVAKGDNLSTTHIDYNTTDNSGYMYGLHVGSTHPEYVFSQFFEDEDGNKYYCDAKGLQTPFDFKEVVYCPSVDINELRKLDLDGKIAVIEMPNEFEREYTAGYYYAYPHYAGADAVIVVSDSDQIMNSSYGYQFQAFLMPYSIGKQLLENAQKLKFDATVNVVKAYSKPYRSEYTNYSFSDSLEPSVDIAAPGGNIFSSVPYNDFANYSGTSMAAPQITGAMALMHEFAEGKYPSYTGKEQSMLIKRLLTSTAMTLYEPNGAISSPRAVGAGIAQLDKAVTTDVIVSPCDSDLTSVALGVVSDTFTVSFKAKNIGTQAITFDDYVLDVSTDDYKYYQKEQDYYFSGIKKLNATSTGFAPVTLVGGEEKTVTLTVTLDGSDVSYLREAMTNGFFVDGKITLKSTTGDNVDVGIPFGGFYGDWNSQSVFDEAMFYTEKDNIAGAGSAIRVVDGKNVMYISQKPESIFLDTAAYFSTTFNRNAYTDIYVGDKLAFSGFINKEKEYYYDLSIKLKDILECMESGNNTMRIETTLPYFKGTQTKQVKEIEFVSDNEKPTINVETYDKDGKKYAKITATDNIEVSSVFCIANDSEGKQKVQYEFAFAKEAEAEFDVTDLKGIDYVVYDSAFNVNGKHAGLELSEDGNTIIIKNTSSDPIQGTLVVAEYTSEGEFIELVLPKGEDCWIPAFEVITYDLTEHKGKWHKLFFIESFESLVPLSKAYESKH